MKSKLIALGVLGMLLISSIRAQAQKTLTLQEAISYALQNSEVIKKAQLDIEKGLNTVEETRASAKPQLNLVSNLVLNPIVQQFVLPAAAFGGKDGEFIAIKAGQNWNGMTSVQLNQQLFNKQVFTGLKAAKTSTEFYKLLKEVSEENVVQQVAANYYQILLNQHKLGILETNLDRVTKLRDVLQGLVDNGLGKKIDVDRVKVNKVNIETQKTQLLNAINLQKNVLKYYMNMPLSEEIILPDEDIAVLQSRVDTWIGAPSLDLDNVIGVKVLKKQDELYSLNAEATKAEFFPRLSLAGQYIQNTQSNKFNLYTGNALNYNMLNFTISLNVPLYDGGARRARLDKTKVDIAKNQSELRETSQALSMAYENAKIQMENSIETIRDQKANLQLAEEVYDNINNNFKLGLVGLTDLLNAEADLATTQTNYNEALLQFKVSEIELIKSRGEIKTLAIK